MKKLRFLMPIWFFVIAATFSSIIMLLWNWLMPAIFGLTAISFWQAMGLFALARILFGNFGFFERAKMHERIHHGVGGNPIHKKWMRMSDEQRREFIEKRRKFGFGHPHPFDMGQYDEKCESAGK